MCTSSIFVCNRAMWSRLWQHMFEQKLTCPKLNMFHHLMVQDTVWILVLMKRFFMDKIIIFWRTVQLSWRSELSGSFLLYTNLTFYRFPIHFSSTNQVSRDYLFQLWSGCADLWPPHCWLLVVSRSFILLLSSLVYKRIRKFRWSDAEQEWTQTFCIRGKENTS